VSGSNAIRGSRVGSSPMRFTERSEPAPRRAVTYFCSAGHEVQILIAADAETPQQWDCTRCGQPAGLDRQNPPGPTRAEPYKTHLAYVKERRSDEDAAAILAEALAKVRQRRGRE
jgi:RNA polymerase-binding protein